MNRKLAVAAGIVAVLLFSLGATSLRGTMGWDRDASIISSVVDPESGGDPLHAPQNSSGACSESMLIRYEKAGEKLPAECRHLQVVKRDDGSYAVVPNESREPPGPGEVPYGAVAALLVGLVVLGGGVGVWATVTAESEPPKPVETDADESVAAVAGATADRIERGGDPDNEVYRAWRDMADALDVARPRSSTPREFAAAAVEAGLDPAGVRQLTRVFEDVRYGTADATEERERRAVAALRRVHAEET